MGPLVGQGSQWSYTTFTLDSSYYDEIADGLKVMIDIDSTHKADYWAVSLAKSVISIDEGELPDPDPGQVPEPATMLLLGFGLAGLAGFKMRFK